jgi:hypothetical protein
MRYTTLALAILLLTPATALASGDPPVRIKLSDRTLELGQREKIRVRAAADGYLVVLQTDTKGNIRVLFPLNPVDDAAIRGGKDFEVRGRGDRDAFTAFDPGSGTILAAWAPEPFHFADFATNGHWNRAGVVADSATTDPESAMLAVVDRMADGHYDYDVAGYAVGSRAYTRLDTGWYGPWYDPWYGPLYYDPWYTSAFSPWGWGYPYYGPGLGVGVVVRPRFEHRRER